MTQQQIFIVQKTWRSFRMMKPEILADIFYSRLFAETPALQKHFPARRQDDRAIQANIFSMIIGKLQHIEEAENLFQQIRNGQQQAGMSPNIYVQVKKALMWMLGRGLADDWTTEVQDAWSACYDEVIHRILQLVPQ